MTLHVSVMVTQVNPDGSQSPVDEELTAALTGSVEQFSSMITWTADQAACLDHADREKTIDESGRELQRRLLEATFTIDSAREQRIGQVTSAAGIRHGTVETGHDRGLNSAFGPLRVSRLAYRNRREANLYPADARWVLPDDPYTLGMRALVAYHVATGGYGQAQQIIAARTGVTIGRAQLTGLAKELAAWTDDFYQLRARTAESDLPTSDVIMMQADGKGIALRPEHRKAAGTDTTHPGIKKMAEIVAVADFTPAVRQPEDIAAPPARRTAHPGPTARDKWVAASITDDIPAMIGKAFDEADRRPRRRGRPPTVRSIRTLVLRLVAGTPFLGIPARARRTPHPRGQGRRIHGLGDASHGGDRSSPGPRDHDLDPVPAVTGRDAPGRRLPRHDHPQRHPPVHPRGHRPCQPPDPDPRRDRAPHCSLGVPGRPQPGHGPRRHRLPGEVPDPRPRRCSTRSWPTPASPWYAPVSRLLG